MGRVGKVVVVTYFEAVSWHLLRRSGESKVAPVSMSHVMTSFRGHGGKSPRILGLDTTWMSVAIFTHPQNESPALNASEEQ